MDHVIRVLVTIVVVAFPFAVALVTCMGILQIVRPQRSLAQLLRLVIRVWLGIEPRNRADPAPPTTMPSAQRESRP